MKVGWQAEDGSEQKKHPALQGNETDL